MRSAPVLLPYQGCKTIISQPPGLIQPVSKLPNSNLPISLSVCFTIFKILSSAMMKSLAIPLSLRNLNEKQSCSFSSQHQSAIIALQSLLCVSR